jgi:Mor family transcriptional regulator
MLKELIEIVGEEKFMEISRVYGGRQIYIPILKKEDKNIRNKEIFEKYTNGSKLNELSKEYNLTTTYIKSIININLNKNSRKNSY